MERIINVFALAILKYRMILVYVMKDFILIQKQAVMNVLNTSAKNAMMRLIALNVNKDLHYIKENVTKVVGMGFILINKAFELVKNVVIFVKLV